MIRPRLFTALALSAGLGGALTGLTGFLTGCQRGSGPSPAPGEAPQAAVPAAAALPRFVEVAGQLGIDFRHKAGLSGRYQLPEIMGAGVALFDFDGDGRLDLYLVNGGETLAGDRGDARSRDRLFQQQADGRFADVSERAGVGGLAYGMGTAVGDIDNDGDLDLYVTGYGGNALYVNRGNGTFLERGAAAGVAGSGWSTSAAFADADNDGWLDLFVARYLRYDPAIRCTTGAGEPDYCTPAGFAGESSILFRNRGDGTFQDVSVESGIARLRSKGLGVCWLDADGDGLSDIYVANDGEPNLLWVNRGDGSFEERGLALGVAVNEMGRSAAGMGVAVGDGDDDGDLDLFVTNLQNETNTLYLAVAHGFHDATAQAGLAVPSLPWTGFGVAWIDCDNDGDLDLAVANGGVARRPGSRGSAELRASYGQAAQLFENQGQGRFAEVSEASGDLAAVAVVGRGLAAGDLDGDGDEDLVISETDGPVRVLRNDSTAKGAHLVVQALDPRTRRDAIGAVVTIEAAGRRWLRRVDPGCSYLSTSPTRAHFGMAAAGRVDRITVRWPGGGEEEFGSAATGQTLRLVRGSGKVEVVGVVAVAGAAAGAGTFPAPVASPTPPPGTAPATVPVLDLSDAEPAVRARLEERRKQVVADPANGKAWGRLGLALHAHQRVAEAAICYRRAAELDPGEARWPYLSGLIHLQADPRTALAELERVATLAPGHPPLLVRQAEAQRALGAIDRAEAGYRQALAADGNNAAAALGVAQMAMRRGDAAAALAPARRATELAPRAAATWRELARIESRLGHPQQAGSAEGEAARALEAADLVADPWLAEVEKEDVSRAAILRRARALGGRGRYPEALAEFDRALAIRGDDAVALNNRAIVRRATGDLAGALADLDRSVVLAPGYDLAHINRAAVRHATGEFRGAIADLDVALRLDPDSVVALTNRAIANIALGEPGAALADLDRALALRPDHAKARDLRARVAAQLDARRGSEGGGR